MDVSIKSLPSENFEEEENEIVRVSGEGTHQGNKTFETLHGLCTYELIETLAAHTGSAKVQTRWEGK